MLLYVPLPLLILRFASGELMDAMDEILDEEPRLSLLQNEEDKLSVD